MFCVWPLKSAAGEHNLAPVEVSEDFLKIFLVLDVILQAIEIFVIFLKKKKKKLIEFSKTHSSSR